MSLPKKIEETLRELKLLTPDGRPIFRISMLLTCPYRYIRLRSPPTVTIASGERMHQRIQEVMKQQGYTPEYEIQYIDRGKRYIITGHIDLYREVVSVGRRIGEIIEIKYSAREGSSRVPGTAGEIVRRAGYIVRGIPITYLAQTYAYAALVYYIRRVVPKVTIVRVKDVIEEYDDLEEIKKKTEWIDIPIPLENLGAVISTLVTRANALYESLRNGWVPRWANEFCPFCPIFKKCQIASRYF